MEQVNMNTMQHEVLIVDDEADIRFSVARILEDEGYVVTEASDSASALSLINKKPPNAILLDIWLENSPLNGMEILDLIRETHKSLPVIMISGHGNIETAVSAINKGAQDFIEKPFTSDRLLLVIKRTIETMQLRLENQELRLKATNIDRLVGSSNYISSLRQIINKVSPTNSRVLVTGPAGSGKTAVATLIHKNSNRAEGPLVSINCAILRPDSLEISLFGQELSSDGGLEEIGTFEQADNGTLILDEVGDMPLETQGKIVRALQEQTFQRVGGAKQIGVDVRVIATSSKSLTELVKAGHFREDLFYRLSVVPVEVSALMDHREDIPDLAEYFVNEMASGSTDKMLEFSEAAIAMLQAYDWPGNVRELRNVVERILIMKPGGYEKGIELEMIPLELNTKSGDNDDKYMEKNILMGLPLREAREIFEKEYLISQISRFGGNISRTASFIGMERSALHRKLKVLGIQSDVSSLSTESSNVQQD